MFVQNLRRDGAAGMPDSLPRDKTALFLDCDGTLAPIVTRPCEAAIPAKMKRILANLHAASGGALAIVSGRSIGQLDVLLEPVRLPLAGTHGIERRDGTGRLFAPKVNALMLHNAVARLREFATQNEGIVLEIKSAAVALHYRQRADLKRACLAFAQEVAASHGLHLSPGKAVIELVALRGSKGNAIAAFMAEPPFAGRVPVYVGDDQTDESAFAEVNRRGGITAKVGPGASVAQLRFAGVKAVHWWLAAIETAWMQHQGEVRE